MTLSEQIEAYLLERRDWVPASELCTRFDLRERALRGLDDVPGLCTLFAISGNKGYKHVALATPEEWRHHFARERKHSIIALMNLRKKRQRREQVIKQLKRPELLIQKTTGQVLMPEVVGVGEKP